MLNQIKNFEYLKSFIHAVSQQIYSFSPRILEAKCVTVEGRKLCRDPVVNQLM